MFDFDAFFEALDEVGYAGAIGLEYIPSGATADGVVWRDRFSPARTEKGY